MANGDQAPGGGGGQRTYSEEDVMALMNEAARRAASEAMKNAQAQKRDEDEDDTAVSVINPKVVKQLKDTVAVFTALKDLSSNPLQKTIEETVGGMAASVVQSAFAPRGPPPKQDIVDKLLNSQFAYGLGSGLGQRAPELVETMGRTFGKDKAGQMMDNIIGKYGSGQGGGQGGTSRHLSSGPSSGPSGTQPPPSAPEQKTDQSEKELLLSLDPNNPEHVSAYAETQGGLPVDVARKMLMIHQDAFIEQLKRDGMNVDQISTQRGSRAQSSPPVQQPSPVQQTHLAQPVPPSSMKEDIPPTYPDSYPGHPIGPSSSKSPDDIEYTEYNDVAHQSPGPNQRPSGQPVPPGSVDGQPVPPGSVDGQQVEMMKTFATDIGKVMGDMLNKIESLNNTVFTLQSEMNDIKMQGPKQTEMPPRIPSYPPGMTEAPMTRTPSSIPPPIITRQSIPIEKTSSLETFETPSLETFEDQGIESPKEELDIKRSGDFFEEDIMDISNFKQELEEDAKFSQKIQQQTSPPGPVQPMVQPVQIVPPISPVVAQPVPSIVVQPASLTTQTQIMKPVQIHQPPIGQPVRPLQQPDAQPVQPIIQHTDKEDKDAPKDENMVDVPKTESELIHDSKTLEEKNDNSFVTPTNGQLKLSKKVGIHKKATYRNIKPSFKKSDSEENKEENNI
jgi:hypothetical protein